MIAREIAMSSLREWAAASASGARHAVKGGPHSCWQCWGPAWRCSLGAPPPAITALTPTHCRYPAVNSLGKWKTALQLVAMSLLLLLRNSHQLLGEEAAVLVRVWLICFFREDLHAAAARPLQP